jgi:hypothetical protein
VKELLSAQKEPGIYEYEIRGDELSSGIYFCEFKATSINDNKFFRSAIKTILLK